MHTKSQRNGPTSNEWKSLHLLYFVFYHHLHELGTLFLLFSSCSSYKPIMFLYALTSMQLVLFSCLIRFIHRNKWFLVLNMQLLRFMFVAFKAYTHELSVIDFIVASFFRLIFTSFRCFELHLYFSVIYFNLFVLGEYNMFHFNVIQFYFKLLIHYNSSTFFKYHLFIHWFLKHFFFSQSHKILLIIMLFSLLLFASIASKQSHSKKNKNQMVGHKRWLKYKIT